MSMLAYDPGDDAPEKYEAAGDGRTRRLEMEMLVSMNASPWPSRGPQCAWSRVAPPLRSSCFKTRRMERASIPGAKLSLPIVIDVMSSEELYMW